MINVSTSITLIKAATLRHALWNVTICS